MEAATFGIERPGNLQDGAQAGGADIYNSGGVHDDVMVGGDYSAKGFSAKAISLERIDTSLGM